MKKLFLTFLIFNFCPASCPAEIIETIRISNNYNSEKIAGSVRNIGNRQPSYRRYYTTRYLIKVDNNSADAQILNKGVDYIINGSYKEAEILLNQVSSPLRGVTANNLAIVYELTGRKNKALIYYLKAYKSDSNNRYFRINFNNR